MLSIEAIVSFTAFVAVIGVFASVLGNAAEDAGAANGALTAKMDAESCSIIIDSFYAGGAGKIKETATGCFMKEPNKVAANWENGTKTAVVLNGSAKQGSAGIEVDVVEHYK